MNNVTQFINEIDGQLKSKRHSLIRHSNQHHRPKTKKRKTKGGNPNVDHLLTTMDTLSANAFLAQYNNLSEYEKQLFTHRVKSNIKKDEKYIKKLRKQLIHPQLRKESFQDNKDIRKARATSTNYEVDRGLKRLYSEVLYEEQQQNLDDLLEMIDQDNDTLDPIHKKQRVDLKHGGMMRASQPIPTLHPISSTSSDSEEEAFDTLKDKTVERINQICEQLTHYIRRYKQHAGTNHYIKDLEKVNSALWDTLNDITEINQIRRLLQLNQDVNEWIQEANHLIRKSNHMHSVQQSVSMISPVAGGKPRSTRRHRKRRASY